MPILNSNFRKTYLTFYGLHFLAGSILGLGLAVGCIFYQESEDKKAAVELAVQYEADKEPKMLEYKNAYTSVQLVNLISTKASAYDVDRSLLSCILKTESNYNLGAISNTEDFGIGQINSVSIAQHKLDKQRLLTDLDYSIDSAAKLLKGLQTRLKDEYARQWPCAYNIGVSGLLRGRKGAACEEYLERINSCLQSGDYLQRPGQLSLQKPYNRYKQITKYTAGHKSLQMLYNAYKANWLSVQAVLPKIP